MYRISDLVSSDELRHYGIKGQQWGRRRFQNEDGSLTPAGKERYDDDGPNEKKQKEYKIPENKSLHRLKLEDKYKAQGMSKQQAEQAAAKRIRGEQYAVAAAAVTVTACIAYNKYKNYNMDKTISSNKEFQRIVKAASADAPVRSGAKYVSYDKMDNMKYQGLWGNELNNKKQNWEQVYKMSIKSDKDIKVASEKRARETFAKLYKEDSEFRNNFINRVADNKGGLEGKMGLAKTVNDIASKKDLTDKQLKKQAYDAFNIMLVDSSDKGRSNADKFYNALKKQGMQAVGDINDKKYSGFGTKNPLILFDGDFEYKKVAMAKEEIQKQNKKATAAVLTPMAIKAGTAYAAIFGAKPLADKMSMDKQVYMYKQEHPNTKMSDKEIRKMLEEQNQGY